MEKVLLISAGAILGANARYWLGSWATSKWGSGFPFGTMLINTSGCFFIGLLMTIIVERLHLDPRWRYFLVIGFLGAYTTFSTFSYESFALLNRAQWGLCLLNVLGSSLLGIAATFLGVLLGKAI